VKEVDNYYRSTLGFPIPANVREVSDTLRDLCTETAPLNQYFGNECNGFLDLDQHPHPPQSDDVWIDPSRNVALIKGQVKTRSTGTASIRSYKHRSLSLMEMLTPWIEMEV
jgi:hypothetical protein